MDLLGSIIVMLMALVIGIVDSSLGMMYGTLLSPILMGWGFNPLKVVPALLLSQAAGGVSGTISHHRFENANFRGLTRDTKIVLAMVIPGLAVVAVVVFVAVNLPPELVKTYIGVLVVVMGLLCLSPIKHRFTWWEYHVIGILAAFNKALTGGGFGPVTSTGGIIGGLGARASVATTTLAKVVICSASFILYMIFHGKFDETLTFSLSLGAIAGGIIGPYISSRVNHRLLRKSVGILAIISGVLLLVDMIQEHYYGNVI